MIDLVVSTCIKKDKVAWQAASQKVIELIPHRKFLVIVPAADKNFFKTISPVGCSVVSETEVISESESNYLSSKILEMSGLSFRKGWYLQQLLKLKSLISLQHNEIGLIWDADTIPLKELNFQDQNELFFYEGTEYNNLYFEQIYKLLGLKRVRNNSFISQCIPAKGWWVHQLIEEIEKRHKKPWIHAIVDTIDFTSQCSFSEYELLGNYFLYHNRETFLPSKRSWFRNGSFLTLNSPPTKFEIAFICFILYPFFDFVAFEHHSSRRQILQTKLLSLLSNFLS